MSNKIASNTAKILIETKCVDFSLKKKFLLTSGKKSPIYCDCRRLISFPKEMKTITNLAVKKIKSLNYEYTFHSTKKRVKVKNLIKDYKTLIEFLERLEKKFIIKKIIIK